MNQAQIKAMQSKLGVTVDGFWGPKSIAACQAYLWRFIKASGADWPRTSQSALKAYYGNPGDEDQLTLLDVSGLDMMFSGSVRLRVIQCHHRVADSLLSILTELHKTHPDLLLRYDGCYNNRPMRGGSLPSLHARGAAIDFDAARNGNTTAWPTKAVMPLEVMEVFARHGWVAAGAFWSRDAMHFQATAV